MRHPLLTTRTAPTVRVLSLVAFMVALLAYAPRVRADLGYAQFGRPKYQRGFQHFDYADPNAIKGGELNLSTVTVNSSFDKYNPFSLKGKPAAGLTELVFETLAVYSLDELNTQYGLLADDISVSPDFGSVTFHLNPKAHFSNGDPVTAADAKYSFDILNSKEASPRFRSYFVDVDKVTVVDRLTVRFDFRRKGRDLPLIAGSLPVFSPKWGRLSAKKRVPFGKLALEQPIASGPYLVDRSPSGQNIVYTRDPHYWGKDLAVRRGAFNFDRIIYKLYKDIDTQVAAIRAGDFDFLSETKMRYWCCQYIGQRFDDKVLIKELLPQKNPHPMNGYIFNLRRKPFDDARVRRAFDCAYDWEWLNRMIFDDQFERQDSYFAGTPLAASGPPSEAELKLLEPYRSELDPAVFGPMAKQPTTRPPGGSYRENLRAAARLFAEAGWRRRADGVMRNDRGEALTLNVSGTPALLEAFYLNLKRLGIQVVYRNSDPAADRENLRKFDFDFTSIALRESRSPGPELYRAFYSTEADVAGSENLVGLKSRAIDHLIDLILNANSEEELETAAHAFDRVMLHHAYVLPWRYLKNQYLIHHKRLHRPATPPDYYNPNEWAMTYWWDGGN